MFWYSIAVGVRCWENAFKTLKFEEMRKNNE